MKKLVAVLAVAALTAVGASVALAASDAGTGIYGTAHDINFKLGPAVRDSQDRLCAYCHTPHHAYTIADGGNAATALGLNHDYAPLWSHELTTQNYVAYTSDRFDQFGGQSMDPTDPLIGPSRLCMSCHDGSLAVDAYYGAQTSLMPGGGTKLSNTAGSGFGTMAKIDADGRKSHPIGFDATNVDPLTAGPGGFADDHLWSGFTNNTYRGNTGTTKVVDRLFLGTMFTCSTCHDVHNKLNLTSGSIKVGTQHYFLLGGQTNSALCITCHNQAEATYGDVHVTNGSTL
jgi:hypothetical protein